MTCDLIFSLQEFFKIVPGLAIFPISFYLAIKKIGTGVSFSYTWTISSLGERISSIVLVNRKDRPAIIKGVIAVCEGIEIDLHTFQEPLILKAYEATRVVPEPYSFLTFKGEKWVIPHKASKGNIDLFLILPDGRHKCKPLFKAPWYSIKKYRPVPAASKHKVAHNDIVYNPDAIKFIVVYLYEGKQMTTFIENSGFISESTGLGVNMLRREEMISPEVAAATLQRATPGLAVNVSWPRA